jgi:hypothetical protein
MKSNYGTTIPENSFGSSIKFRHPKQKVMKRKIKILRCAYFVFVCLLFESKVLSQDQQLQYKIMLSGNEIGSMFISKSTAANNTRFSMKYNAKKHFIVSFEMSETHDEMFQNNVMTNASVFRQVNGKTKINAQMNFEGTNCVIISEGKTSSIFVQPVSWSVLNLYFAEPEKITEAFSDSFQQMLKIENMDTHNYKIKLPDGNSNYFYYINGICTKEIINHSFYKIELMLQMPGS